MQLSIHNYRRCLRSWLATFAVTIVVSHSVNAHAWQEEPAVADAKSDEAASDWKTESGKSITRIVSGFSNPTGIAIQPETGVVFVADSGHGQVVRVMGDKLEPVLTDFPVETLGTDPGVRIGPLSLGFLSKSLMVVGCGGGPPGEDALRTYAIAESGDAAKYDSSIESLVLPASSDQTQPAEGNFFGLVVGPTAVYVASQGDADRGWIDVAARPTSDAVSELERHIATVPLVGTRTPVALTISPHGYLLAANLGAMNNDADSVAAFYDSSNRQLLMKLELGLRDVCSLAYSPRRQLYALDLAWSDPAAGGLFRLVEDKSAATGIKAKLIAKLPHPTAMCFDADGGLLVTLRGEVDADGNSQGQLVRIPPEENL